MRRAFALLLIGAMVVPACGGSDDGGNDVASTTTAAQDDTPITSGAADDDAAEEAASNPSGSSDTATVTIGDNTHVLTDPVMCRANPDEFFVNFTDGDDELLLSVVAGKLVIKVVIDGIQWRNPATQVEPHISGDTIVWEDVMSGVGPDTTTTEQVRFEVNC